MKGEIIMKAENKLAAKTKSVDRIIAPPPSHWVGDGFKVHGFFPNQYLSAQRMSPFYLLDYNAKINFPPSTNLLGVGAHPHRGFETVTIAYKGKVQHHDSTGGGGIIGEGDVQWMTAGSGLLHKEYHEEEFNREGGLFQMVQLWVNLPAKDKMTKPQYQAITNDQMGRYELPEGKGTVEVIAGEFNGVKGAATTFSPVHLYNLKLQKGASVKLNFSENDTTALLMIEGEAKINQTEIAPTDNFVLFKRDGEEIFVEATDDSVILVMSGKPLDEPIAAYGPFLMNTQEEIEQAFEDFQTGKFGYLAD
jgi:redox-sensitive bicupin YhaK (pirin superfamily)